jgi:hypothetical protein
LNVAGIKAETTFPDPYHAHVAIVRKRANGLRVHAEKLCNLFRGKQRAHGSTFFASAASNSLSLFAIVSMVAAASFKIIAVAELRSAHARWA